MQGNPSQSLASAREAARHPRPSARIQPATVPALAPALKANGGSFNVELRAFMAASSPAEIATAIRDLFTEPDQVLICRMVRYGTDAETETPLHHLNGEPYSIEDTP